jgi:hypothetical protein
MIRNVNDMDLTDGQEPIDYIEYAEMHYDHDRYERAAVACQIATAKAAERQAAALERIAAVLEKVTNNEMLSVAFWEQV